ncbi:hypothetical protein [Bacteroides sp. 519]|uniref:hypothetical protein n=1 Tax=Bacteroides sp. 519 TaxID=2302937 RepID=UPI0013D82703|nr:hypothetical protein [Bacteroides sp. 519]NDV58992.1 hypothetical protein [Bacteroides sp. 519]
MRLFRSSISRILGLIVKHPHTSFIIGIVSVVLTLVFGHYSLQTRNLNVSELMVGYAPYQVSDKETLEDRNLILLKGANNYLRKQRSAYRLYPSIANGNYVNVLNDLEKKDVHIAFVSQGIYALLKNRKLPDHENALNNHCFNADKFKEIGYKKHGLKEVYKAGILHNDKINLNDSILFDLKSYLNQKGIKTIILNEDSYSTSSSIFPKVFLLERQINPENGDFRFLKESRKAMIDSVKKNSSTIGFLSNEDFESLKDKDSLKFIEIPIPVPYDAILVNSKWWTSIGRSNQKIIKEALNEPPLGIVNVKAQESSIGMYHQYLFSGVIFEDSIKDRALVQLPEDFLDIYELHKQVDSVYICKFGFDNIDSNLFSFKPPVLIDSTVLKREDNKYYIPKKGNIKRGMHVLPKNKLISTQ